MNNYQEAATRLYSYKCLVSEKKTNSNQMFTTFKLPTIGLWFKILSYLAIVAT